MKIGVVGVCAAGKSTLIKQLTDAGYEVRHIAQEHSFVPSMWQKITNPDVLIYLNASYETTRQRRKFDWRLSDWEEQVRRLSHAYEHADLIIDTDPLTPEDIFNRTVSFLKNLSI